MTLSITLGLINMTLSITLGLLNMTLSITLIDFADSIIIDDIPYRVIILYPTLRSIRLIVIFVIGIVVVGIVLEGGW